jgi:TPR repeat protein
LLEKGVGVSQNYTKAALTYKAAALSGSAEGQFRYGTMLEKGLGVKQKIGKAA